MTAGSIERFGAHRLRIPLARPYKLAFGAVTHYDTILVRVTLDDGREGWGEATLLTGYTEETIDASWRLACELASGFSGASVTDTMAQLRALAVRAPFVASAIASALEWARGHALLDPQAGMRVPLLGLLQGEGEDALRAEFERLHAGGYRTVKVKVGFDPSADAHHVATVQRVVGARARIRIDANQGYDAPAAARFIGAIDPAGIELFEQPCAAGDWTAHAAAARAARATGLALMLDESIYGLADIERAAAEHACRYLKVKLMKFPGLDALTAAIERIRAAGMVPILGNGVACDLSCWMEASVAARHVDTAGEMNGFLKAARMLFTDALECDQDAIVLPSARPAIDPAALAMYTVAEIAQPDIASPCAAPRS